MRRGCTFPRGRRMPTEARCGGVRQVSARPVHRATRVFLSESERLTPLGLSAVEALIPTARSGDLHFHRRPITRAPERPTIKSGDAWALRWQRLIVEVLVVAATFALAFAATDTSGHGPLLSVAGALVGAGLIFEPKVTVPRGLLTSARSCCNHYSLTPKKTGRSRTSLTGHFLPFQNHPEICGTWSFELAAN